MPFTAVAARLQSLVLGAAGSESAHAARSGAIMVGIGGHGASGKSTLSRTLADTLLNSAHVGAADVGAADVDSVVVESVVESVVELAGIETQIVGTDEFWTGQHFDLDQLRTSVVEPIANGVSGQFTSWHWASQRFIGERTIYPRGLVIVEGVCALHRMFRDHYAYRIWVDAPYDTRVARGVARDGEDMRNTWVNLWIPNEEAYVAADDPHSCVDAFIDGTVDYS